MLKIKDSVNLNKLEQFNFKSCGTYVDPQYEYTDNYSNSLLLVKNRIIYLVDDEGLDMLYTLITEGMVEQCNG